jgi:hypothetical protein
MKNGKEVIGSYCLWLLLIFLVPCFATAGEPEGKIILKESANGSRSLRPFTIQDKWEVRWESTNVIYIYLRTEKGDRVASLASSTKAGRFNILPEGWNVLS